MSASDNPFENWWNGLKPEQRVDILRLIPLRPPEQIAVFSSRCWHELHGWMRDHLRKVYAEPGLLDKFDLLSYFRAQGCFGRSQCVHGVLYFVISEADRESFPELGHSYAIALEELPTTGGKAQCWLIAGEAEYDDEVLLALSSLGLSSTDQKPRQ
jgi:hypothetical protein